MAFKININDLKGILLWVLLSIAFVAPTNIDCNGKPFHCVNSTHFMICVDLGGGVSSTIDNFLIPCPPTTVCMPNNRFECEFPPSTTPLPVLSLDEVTVTDGFEEMTTNGEISTVKSEITNSSSLEDSLRKLSSSNIFQETVIDAPIQSEILLTTLVPETNSMSQDVQINTTVFKSGLETITTMSSDTLTNLNNVNENISKLNINNVLISSTTLKPENFHKLSYTNIRQETIKEDYIQAEVLLITTSPETYSTLPDVQMSTNVFKSGLDTIMTVPSDTSSKVNITNDNISTLNVNSVFRSSTELNPNIEESLRKLNSTNILQETVAEAPIQVEDLLTTLVPDTNSTSPDVQISTKVFKSGLKNIRIYTIPKNTLNNVNNVKENISTLNVNNVLTSSTTLKPTIERSFHKLSDTNIPQETVTEAFIQAEVLLTTTRPETYSTSPDVQKSTKVVKSELDTITTVPSDTSSKVNITNDNISTLNVNNVLRSSTELNPNFDESFLKLNSTNILQETVTEAPIQVKDLLTTIVPDTNSTSPDVQISTKVFKSELDTITAIPSGSLTINNVHKKKSTLAVKNVFTSPTTLKSTTEESFHNLSATNIPQETVTKAKVLHKTTTAETHSRSPDLPINNNVSKIGLETITTIPSHTSTNVNISSENISISNVHDILISSTASKITTEESFHELISTYMPQEAIRNASIEAEILLTTIVPETYSTSPDVQINTNIFKSGPVTLTTVPSDNSRNLNIMNDIISTLNVNNALASYTTLKSNTETINESDISDATTLSAYVPTDINSDIVETTETEMLMSQNKPDTKNNPDTSVNQRTVTTESTLFETVNSIIDNANVPPTIIPTTTSLLEMYDNKSNKDNEFVTIPDIRNQNIEKNSELVASTLHPLVKEYRHPIESVYNNPIVKENTTTTIFPKKEELPFTNETHAIPVEYNKNKTILDNEHKTNTMLDIDFHEITTVQYTNTDSTEPAFAVVTKPIIATSDKQENFILKHHSSKIISPDMIDIISSTATNLIEEPIPSTTVSPLLVITETTSNVENKISSTLMYTETKDVYKISTYNNETNTFEGKDMESTPPSIYSRDMLRTTISPTELPTKSIDTTISDLNQTSPEPRTYIYNNTVTLTELKIIATKITNMSISNNSIPIFENNEVNKQSEMSLNMFYYNENNLTNIVDRISLPNNEALGMISEINGTIDGSILDNAKDRFISPPEEYIMSSTDKMMNIETSTSSYLDRMSIVEKQISTEKLIGSLSRVISPQNINVSTRTESINVETTSDFNQELTNVSKHDFTGETIGTPDILEATENPFIVLNISNVPNTTKTTTSRNNPLENVLLNIHSVTEELDVVNASMSDLLVNNSVTSRLNLDFPSTSRYDNRGVSQYSTDDAKISTLSEKYITITFDDTTTPNPTKAKANILNQTDTVLENSYTNVLSASKLELDKNITVQTLLEVVGLSQKSTPTPNNGSASGKILLNDILNITGSTIMDIGNDDAIKLIENNKNNLDKQITTISYSNNFDSSDLPVTEAVELNTLQINGEKSSLPQKINGTTYPAKIGEQMEDKIAHDIDLAKSHIIGSINEVKTSTMRLVMEMEKKKSSNSPLPDYTSSITSNVNNEDMEVYRVKPNKISALEPHNVAIEVINLPFGNREKMLTSIKPFALEISNKTIKGSEIISHGFDNNYTNKLTHNLPATVEQYAKDVTVNTRSSVKEILPIVLTTSIWNEEVITTASPYIAPFDFEVSTDIATDKDAIDHFSILNDIMNGTSSKGMYSADQQATDDHIHNISLSNINVNDRKNNSNIDSPYIFKVSKQNESARNNETTNHAETKQVVMPLPNTDNYKPNSTFNLRSTALNVNISLSEIELSRFAEYNSTQAKLNPQNRIMKHIYDVQSSGTVNPIILEKNISSITNGSVNKHTTHKENVKQVVPFSTRNIDRDKSLKNTYVPQFDCQKRNRGKYSDNTDCRKFYICLGKHDAIVGMCPVNTVFSDIRKQCTKNLSHCVRNNQFQCVSEGRFSDFSNNSIYYICVKNNLNKFLRFKLQCQRGYELNKTNVRCEHNENTLSQSAFVRKDRVKKNSDQSVTAKSAEYEQSSNQKDFKCEEEGKFIDPKDCRKYYVCYKNKSVFRRKNKKCDSDEVFDKDKKKCVDADSYDC